MSVVDSPTAAEGAFSLLTIVALWRGTDPVLGGPDNWTLYLLFHAAASSTTAHDRLPKVLPGNIKIYATDGTSPAPIAVLAVQRLPDFPQMLEVIVAAVGPQPLLGPRQYILAIEGVPQLFASGAAARFELATPTSAPVTPAASAQAVEQADISYLAKDYPALREAMLARLRQLVPAWQEESPADIGVTLVEVLAYAADYLSYYQDAVAGEAYITTARRRVSIRRHARLLGYRLLDGCNARSFVQTQVVRAHTVPVGTVLLAGTALAPVVAASDAACQAALAAGAVVFETMEEARLHPALNAIPFYCWGETDFMLPAGSTLAFLSDAWLEKPAQGSPGRRNLDALRVGDVVVFEQQRNPTTGDAATADPTLRHAVRILRIDRPVLPGGSETPEGVPVVSIGWSEDEALPFDLVIARLERGRAITDIAVTRGNIVLADHGRSMHAALPPVPRDLPYRPVISDQPIVRAVPFDAAAARKLTAAAVLAVDSSDALPLVRLTERFTPWPQPPASTGAHPGPARPPPGALHWLPRADLFGSGPFARDFVTESEDGGSTTLRFGDGVFGRRPNPDSAFAATFRIGDMTEGNVAPETISTLVAPDAAFAALKRDVHAVRNPQRAVGAVSAEPIAAARRFAPEAYKVSQSLAAFEDYVVWSRRFRDVDVASAELIWTGTWPTVAVYVRRKQGMPADPAFCAALAQWLEPRRIGGRMIAVYPAQAVALAIKLRVVPQARQSALRLLSALKQAFAATPGGYFAPQRWPLNATVYGSAIVACAMGVAGVREAQVLRLRRLDRAERPGSHPPLPAVPLGRREYPRVDNDPLVPHNGSIEFAIVGDAP
jgi:hypothetical protein